MNSVPFIPRLTLAFFVSWKWFSTPFICESSNLTLHISILCCLSSLCIWHNCVLVFDQMYVILFSVPTGPENVCTEISDFINFGLSMTKLPDPNDCRRYYTCENQKLKGDSDCVSVTYDMDNHYCNFNAKCLFPDPRAWIGHTRV